MSSSGTLEMPRFPSTRATATSLPAKHMYSGKHAWRASSCVTEASVHSTLQWQQKLRSAAELGSHTLRCLCTSHPAVLLLWSLACMRNVVRLTNRLLVGSCNYTADVLSCVLLLSTSTTPQNQPVLMATFLLLQVSPRPHSKPQTLLPHVAAKGKIGSGLTEAAHLVPYHVRKAPVRSAKAAQHAAATSQATTAMSYSSRLTQLGAHPNHSRLFAPLRSPPLALDPPSSLGPPRLQAAPSPARMQAVQQ